METETKHDRAFYLKVLQEAHDAAKEATEAYLTKIGGDQYPCGFAWIKIKPARGGIVSVMKDLGLGKVDDFNGGWMLWNPSGNHCQNVDAKVAGAEAYVAAVKKHLPDLNIFSDSRWD